MRLATRAAPSRNSLETRFVRDVRGEDLLNSNLILLSARHMNPWVELFERDVTIRLDHDEVSANYRVVNTRPAAGQPREFDVSSTDAQKQIYGVVNYRRNGLHYLLMISGTAVAGTESAACFVMDDAKFVSILETAAKQDRMRDFDLLRQGRNLGAGPHKVQ